MSELAKTTKLARWAILAIPLRGKGFRKQAITNAALLVAEMVSIPLRGKGFRKTSFPEQNWWLDGAVVSIPLRGKGFRKGSSRSDYSVRI